jgi:hypothetical protein
VTDIHIEGLIHEKEIKAIRPKSVRGKCAQAVKMFWTKPHQTAVARCIDGGPQLPHRIAPSTDHLRRRGGT